MKDRVDYKNKVKKSIDKISNSKLKEVMYFIKFLVNKKEAPQLVSNERRLILNSAGLWNGELEGIEYENRLRSKWTTRLKED